MEHHTLNPLQQSQADYITSQLLSELSVGSGELESWPDKLKVLKMSRPGTRSKTVTLPFFSECSTQVVLFVLFKNICMPSCFHLNVFSTEMIISSYLEILVAKLVKSIQYFHTDGHYSTIIFPQYLHFNH